MIWRLHTPAYGLRPTAFSLRLCSMAAVLLLRASDCAPVSASEDASAEARAWVEQLRDHEYEMRRLAADKLAALGEAAREVLEQAARSEDVETRAEAEVLLKKLESAFVSLLVFDRDGQAAAGVEGDLRVYMPHAGPDWNEQASRSVTVSADGTASVAGLLPGEGGLHFNWQQRFVTPECSPSWSFHFSRGDNPVFVTLAKGGAAEIRVQDSSGAPLKDATVQLFPEAHFSPELVDLQSALCERWGQNIPAGVSGADGAARVEAAEGSYQCVVQAYGFLPCLAGTVRLAEGQSAKIPEVKLEKKNAGQVRLTLLKSDGEPVKKTRISVLLEYQFAGPEAERLQREALRLRVQLSMRGMAGQSETDEQGKITVDDLRPGNYTLTLNVSYGEEAPWRVPGLVIEGGQTKDLAPLKPCAVGAIEGKIAGGDSKGLRYSSVSAALEGDLVDGFPGADGNPNWGFRMQQRFGGSRSVQTQENGRYTLKNLVPGRYAVCINTRSGQQVLIFGLEVSADKTTKAPEAVIPAPAGGPPSQEIKGAVLSPTGTPAEGARVTLYSQGGSSQGACDEKGSFRLHETGSAGGHLIVKSGGCRPLCVDVSAPGLKLDDLALRLEKQEYGSLRVKVVDESGKALSGVTLLLRSPRSLRNYPRGNQQERQFVTNRSGEVKLTGLAVGERGLQLQCDGYCPPEDFKAFIAPNTEAQATAVLRKGLVLSGRVEAPEGSAYPRTVACLLGNANRTSRVTAEGRFTFSGLPAGTYSAIAYAPGLITAEPAQVVLSLDAAPPSPPPGGGTCLKLVRPCGAAITVDKRFEGWSAVLVPKGSWDPLSMRKPGAGRPQLCSCVDSAGRAEFLGAAPGEYDVLLSLAPDRFGYAFSSQPSRKPATAPLQLVAGPIVAGPLRDGAELHALPAVVLKTGTGSASVSGRLVCPKTSAEAGDNLASVSIGLVGRAAVGRIDFGYPSALTRASRRKPLIIGTPPVGMPLEFPEPGSFTFDGVPPGEYKVVAQVERYSQSNRRAARENPRQPPVVLAAIVVPAEANLDLGKLRYDLPLLASRPEDAVDDWREAQWRSEAEPEDQIPFFQP